MEEKDIVKWQLKWISSHTDDLNESEHEWAIKMEESFKRKGFLSKREMEIVENIYKKC
jgi:hypothetical protein